jgi:GNAT superfamily N-acetyltransferase
VANVRAKPAEDIVVKAVTPSRWDDLATLFGPSGAYSGCWCMWHRVSSAEFAANGNAGNRAAMESLVTTGRRPGLLAYIDGNPVGWVSVAPRSQFGRIERSPLFKRRDPSADDRGVWSINCFFIHRGHRGEGIASALVKSAVEFASKNGARAVEGYPIDPRYKAKWSSPEAYHGTAEMFRAAGFEEVERRKDARPLMCYEVPRGTRGR